MDNNTEVLCDASLAPAELGVQGAINIRCDIEFNCHLAISEPGDCTDTFDFKSMSRKFPRELHIAGVGIGVRPRVVHVDRHPDSLVDSRAQCEIVAGVALVNQRTVVSIRRALVVDHQESCGVHFFGVGNHIDCGEVRYESSNWDKENTVLGIIRIARSFFIRRADRRPLS